MREGLFSANSLEEEPDSRVLRCDLPSPGEQSLCFQALIHLPEKISQGDVGIHEIRIVSDGGPEGRNRFG